jgi:probable F420-dependent oxidoreductase
LTGRPQLTGVGIWSVHIRGGDAGLSRELAGELESLGYTALWYSGGSRGGFEVARRLLAATRDAVVAPGILSIWRYDPVEVAQQHHELSGTYPGRFLLGLGVSHRPFVGEDYRHPVTAMIAYLDTLDQADPPVPPSQRILAALGPRMLRLAADRSAGAHPYLGTPEHTARAREQLGPAALLAPELGVVLDTDPGRARSVARRHLAQYLALPNYLNNWRRSGFDDADLTAGGSDRLVDALIAWGDERAVAARIRAHQQAGADHVCVQVLSEEGDRAVPPRPQWRRLAEAIGG